MSWEHHADQIRKTIESIEDSCGRWQECIFRGEPQKYPRPCSSTLWREYACNNVLGFVDGMPEDVMSKVNLNDVQAQIVEEAKEYSGELSDEFELLTYLRHHGGATNLIDFTSSVHIALFFACHDFHEEDGCVYIQNTDAIKDWIKRPNNLNSRAMAQRSVFIESPQGFVDATQDIPIPKDIKDGMVEYLRLFYDVSARTIYYDLIGFIQSYSVSKSMHEALRDVMKQQARKHLLLDSKKSDDTTTKDNDLIITNYSKVLTYDPTNPMAYNGKGIAFHEQGEYDNAIREFTKAVEVFPSDQSYSNLAASYYRKGEYKKAIFFLSKAIECFPSNRLYVKRGDTYFRSGEYDRAEIDYVNAKTNKDLIQVKGNWNLVASYKLAILKLKTKEYVAALDEINDVVEQDEENFLGGYSYCIRGVVFLCLEDWKTAEQNFSRYKNSGAKVNFLLQDDFESIASFVNEIGISPPRYIRKMLEELK